MVLRNNIRLIIAYDGTAYQGWQDSIEGALRKVLEKIYQHPIELQAASRTDAGVHAHGQVANFLTFKILDLGRVADSLNQLLPKDLIIRDIHLADSGFHPTLNAVGKEYRYYISIGKFQLPHHRFYSWHVYQPLNIPLIIEGSKILEGEHDFSAFCNHSVDSYKHCIRNVHSIKIEALEDNRYCFIIKGNNFLYRMVRNIVGTLVDLGRNKIAFKDFVNIIASQDRTRAGISAPAHGLFLHEVYYEED